MISNLRQVIEILKSFGELNRRTEQNISTSNAIKCELKVTVLINH